MSKTIRLESPFEEYPGYLEVVDHLDALRYNDWFKKAQELADDEDNRHGIFKIWEARIEFIVDVKMDLGKGYEIEPSGLKLPDPRIAYWFADASAFLIDNAQDPKNWRGLSDDTLNTEQS